MIRNTKKETRQKETRQKQTVVPRTRMASHAENHESRNVKEAEVWKRYALIDQKIVQRTVQRIILRTIVKIEIGTMMGAINANALQNVNEVIIVPQNAIVKDRHKQSVVMVIAPVKYQVNEAKAKFI